MKEIKSAFISVFNKDNLKPLVQKLHTLNVKIFSSGGTKIALEKLNISVTSVEEITQYPSILGGRVKTLHPKIFGGILSRRNNKSDSQDVVKYDIRNEHRRRHLVLVMGADRVPLAIQRPK